jgi:hypothetical protein
MIIFQHLKITKCYGVTVLRCYGVTAINSFYRKEVCKLSVKRALGKRVVSLGESGGFVRGKSEFPLTKVQKAEKG